MSPVISFLLFDAITGLSVISVPVLMVGMYAKAQMLAFKWYGLVVFPLGVLGWLCWRGLKQKIRRDMAAANEGASLRNGIPHHGMLIILGIKTLLSFGVWVC